MFERFTDRARKSLAFAQDEAKAMGHNFLGTEHLLLGLLREGHGVAGRALAGLGLEIQSTRNDICEIVGAGPALAGDAEVLRCIGIDLDEVLSAATESFGADKVDRVLRKVPRGDEVAPALVPRAKKVLELSLREAKTLGHNYIGTEHILLGIVREGEGVAAQILVMRTRGLGAVRDAVIETMTLRRSGTKSAGLTSAPLQGRDFVQSAIPEGASILELGSGAGRVTRHLATGSRGDSHGLFDAAEAEARRFGRRGPSPNLFGLPSGTFRGKGGHTPGPVHRDRPVVAPAAGSW